MTYVVHWIYHCNKFLRKFRKRDLIVENTLSPQVYLKELKTSKSFYTVIIATTLHHIQMILNAKGMWLVRIDEMHSTDINVHHESVSVYFMSAIGTNAIPPKKSQLLL